jgi:Secretion system C-terminal sorting domain
MYGQAYPWTEITAGRTLQHGANFYTVYHQDQGNTFNSYLTFQAIDQSGDTLFTRRILDMQHPFSVQGFESSLTTTDMFASGLKQNFVPLAYTNSFLARFNEQGDSLWYHEYTNSNTYFNFIGGLSLQVNTNDDILALGFTTHDLAEPYDDQPAQIYLMKCDGQGTRSWDHTYGDVQVNEQPRDLTRLSDGGYLVVGYSTITVSLIPFIQVVRSFILRTDSLGNELSFTYFPDDNLGLSSIAKLSDGGYAITGGWCPNSNDTCGGALVKLNSTGTVEWKRVFTGAETTIPDGFWDVVELSSGALLACGESYEGTSTVGWLVKTDPAGYLIWQRFIDKTPSYDSFTRITACSDGGILLTGQAQRDQLSDVWLVKLDSLGCDSAGCPLDIHTGVEPTGATGAAERQELTAIPNPFNTRSTLTCSVPITARELRLRVMDLQGRVVEERRVSNQGGRVNETISSSGMNDGVYVCTLTADGAVLGITRIVVQH